MDIDELRTAYDVVAAEYASRFGNELDAKPFDRWILDWFSSRVDDSQAVLDVGCGPGHVAAYLHRRGANVRGIDLSEEMVRQARRRHNDISFEQGNMLTFDGIADASLGGIVAFYSLVNFDDQEVAQALRQMRRVLRTAGVLLLAVHLGEGQRRVERFLDHDASLDFTFFGSGELRNVIESAGFTVTESIEREPYAGHEYPSRRLYVFASPR